MNDEDQNTKKNNNNDFINENKEDQNKNLSKSHRIKISSINTILNSEHDFGVVQNSTDNTLNFSTSIFVPYIKKSNNNKINKINNNNNNNNINNNLNVNNLFLQTQPPQQQKQQQEQPIVNNITNINYSNSTNYISTFGNDNQFQSPFRFNNDNIKNNSNLITNNNQTNQQYSPLPTFNKIPSSINFKPIQSQILSSPPSVGTPIFNNQQVDTTLFVNNNSSVNNQFNNNNADLFSKYPRKPKKRVSCEYHHKRCQACPTDCPGRVSHPPRPHPPVKDKLTIGCNSCMDYFNQESISLQYPNSQPNINRNSDNNNNNNFSDNSNNSSNSSGRNIGYKNISAQGQFISQYDTNNINWNITNCNNNNNNSNGFNYNNNNNNNNSSNNNRYHNNFSSECLCQDCKNKSAVVNEYSPSNINNNSNIPISPTSNRGFLNPFQNLIQIQNLNFNINNNNNNNNNINSFSNNDDTNNNNFNNANNNTTINNQTTSPTKEGQCRMPSCIVCKNGAPPSFAYVKPYWAHIIYLSLFALNKSSEVLESTNQIEHQNFCVRSNGIRFFKLQSIFKFIEVHWDIICFKDKDTYWKKKIGMTLSHYPQHFENGLSTFQISGYWALKIMNLNPYSINFINNFN